MRQERIEIRAFAEEKETLAKAAKLLHTKVTSFIRDTIMTRAEEIIRQHDRMILTDRDRDLFMNALENPPKPNKNLRKAMKDHFQKTGR